MYGALWAEISVWLGKMPEPIRVMYEWSNNHVKMKESPENWFARARTSTKENPEALSGIHADYMMQIIDEASAVPDEIMDNAEATLTNADYVTLKISNPTRIVGRFFDSHHKYRKFHQCFHFSAESSPVVNRQKVLDTIAKY